MMQPVSGNGESIDITETLIGAIAHKLWELYNGDSQLNWLEAEMLLYDLLGPDPDGATHAGHALQHVRCTPR